MARSKVRYKLIANESTRRRTFRKRKSGLLKKLNELKMLCNVDACAIIYNEHEARPDVWPSPPEAFCLIERLKNLPSTPETTSAIDQEGFLSQNLLRLLKNLDKETKNVQSLEMERLLAKCLNDNHVHEATYPDDLKPLLCLLEEKIEMVNGKITDFEHSNSTRCFYGK